MTQTTNHSATLSRAAKTDPAPDISVLVLAHAEGLLIHRTLKSVTAALAEAAKQSLFCEIVVILDRADADTRRFVQGFSGLQLRILEVDLGDPSLAREAGRAVAQAKYIALVDGDDLLGTDWLVKAWHFAEQQLAPSFILHAQHQVFFEAENFAIKYFPSTGPESNGFDPMALVHTNPWTSILFFNRLEFADRPFKFISRSPQIPQNFGFGYEDWHWLAEQLDRGAHLLVVPETCNFVRRKHSQSILKLDGARQALLPPSRLLDPVAVATRGSTEPFLPSKKPSKLRKLGQKVKGFFRKHCPEAIQLLARLKGGVKRLLHARKKSLPQDAPAWQAKIWQDCGEMHAIEPKIFPSMELLGSPRQSKPSGPLTARYRQLCQKIARRPTHVILVPWLKRGGADLETRHYVEAICQASPENYPIVIATNDSDSPWASRLPAGVPFIPLGQQLTDVSVEDQLRLLATFLVQLQVPIIQNMNSRLGYLVFRQHGPALRNHSRLFASVFCEDITPAGRTVGFAFDEIADCYPHLSGIFADNQTILDRLNQTFGYPAEKLCLHYMPSAELPAIAIPDRPLLQVLWAGRLDRQKRPDLLYRIAEKLVGQPIKFSIYGSELFGRGKNAQNWSRLKNVSYLGPYDGFESLPLEKFDLLLHTAQWEGLPNVLIEAFAHALPVVASGVGGVPEIVLTGENGDCIVPFDEIDQYCQALIRLQANRQQLTQFGQAGQRLVRERHTWSAFLERLSHVPGYLHPLNLPALGVNPSRAA